MLLQCLWSAGCPRNRLSRAGLFIDYSDEHVVFVPKTTCSVLVSSAEAVRAERREILHAGSRRWAAVLHCCVCVIVWLLRGADFGRCGCCDDGLQCRRTGWLVSGCHDLVQARRLLCVDLGTRARYARLRGRLGRSRSRGPASPLSELLTKRARRAVGTEGLAGG